MSKLKVVVFTGAGISAESGISTFRDSDGLWANFKVDEVCTPEAFKKDPKKVLDFYNSRREDILKAEPNAAHKTLAELEEKYDITIITQNIDDLHERAGSTNVLHLHGEIMKCRGVGQSESDPNPKLYDYNSDLNVGDICGDGTQMRPHVVWFGEQVPNLPKAKVLTFEADVFVVIGSSLQVYPAASLLDYVRVNVPIYVIDKNIPFITKRFTPIEEVATKGVDILVEMLEMVSSLKVQS
jgi:NAD-dependent deacetylase